MSVLSRRCESTKETIRRGPETSSPIEIPDYSSRQTLKQEVPVLLSIQRWSDQLESMLQDCFDHADWDMFQVSSENNIDVYT